MPAVLLKVLALSAILLSGCASYQTYSPAPIDTEQVFRDYKYTDLNSLEIKSHLAEQGLDVREWPRRQWDLESLVALGKFFSADLTVAEAKFEVARAAEITAAQKINPELDLSAEYHSEHEDVSPWTLGSIFSFVIERPGKRATRIDYAKAVTEEARLERFEIEWQVRAAVTASYLDTLAAIGKVKLLQEEIAIVDQGLEILERRVDMGATSDFELSSSRLARQRLRLAISEAEAEQLRARSRLALAAGLPANKLDQVTLDQTRFQQLPDLNDMDLGLDRLQVRALIERPDVLRSLSGYVVAEADLHQEIENQYQDINLSPGYIFDQGDNLWALASAIVLPVYDRNQGPIAEAEARRSLKAEEFLALQGEVLNQVHESRRGYATSLTTLAEANSLLAELEQRGIDLQSQYDKGFIDSLALSRNQFERIAVQRSCYLLEVAAWRQFAGLENALMSTLR